MSVIRRRDIDDFEQVRPTQPMVVFRLHGSNAASDETYAAARAAADRIIAAVQEERRKISE